MLQKLFIMELFHVCVFCSFYGILSILFYTKRMKNCYLYSFVYRLLWGLCRTATVILHGNLWPSSFYCNPRGLNAKQKRNNSRFHIWLSLQSSTFVGENHATQLDNLVNAISHLWTNKGEIEIDRKNSSKR